VWPHGDRAETHQQLTATLPDCLRTMKYFSTLWGEELPQPRASRAEVRLLNRHLAVAVAAVASCQIGLGQDQHAFGQSGAELGLLRQAVRWTFRETVARDPAPYLLQPMSAYGVTIDLMARVYQQARAAGALDPCPDESAAA
jgi:hypothetical protein